MNTAAPVGLGSSEPPVACSITRSDVAGEESSRPGGEYLGEVLTDQQADQRADDRRDLVPHGRPHADTDHRPDHAGAGHQADLHGEGAPVDRDLDALGRQDPRPHADRHCLGDEPDRRRRPPTTISFAAITIQLRLRQMVGTIEPWRNSSVNERIPRINTITVSTCGTTTRWNSCASSGTSGMLATSVSDANVPSPISAAAVNMSQYVLLAVTTLRTSDRIASFIVRPPPL